MSRWKAIYDDGDAVSFDAPSVGDALARGQENARGRQLVSVDRETFDGEKAFLGIVTPLVNRDPDDEG